MNINQLTRLGAQGKLSSNVSEALLIFMTNHFNSAQRASCLPAREFFLRLTFLSLNKKNNFVIKNDLLSVY